MEKVEELFLKIPNERQKWIKFLQKFDLNLSNEEEINQLDETVAIFSETGEILATGSVSGNVIKYVATSSKNEENSGERFNQIVTNLSNRLSSRGVFHLFVFTKPIYASSFGYLGFKVLAESDSGVLLEKGRPNIQDYLAEIPKADASRKTIAAIVMNANPFTKGHRYLVEKAVEENDFVYVFVVSTDRSLFRTNERLELVRAGLAHYKNVQVVSGGDYMVSFATFPAYFIKTPEEVIDFQTKLDARLFKKWIVPYLGITSRYLGSEPFSKTTGIYNKTLKKELSNQISVEIVERKAVENQAISATRVRRAIAENNFGTIREIVPETTYNFIVNHLDELQERIRRGQKIDGN